MPAPQTQDARPARRLAAVPSVRPQAEAAAAVRAGTVDTATLLDLLPEPWVVLRHVGGTGRGRAVAELVVVGPGGVFVVGAWDWPGALALTDHGFTVDGRTREDAVRACSDAALAICEAAALPPQVVRSVLCLERREEVAGWASDVMVCTSANLLSLLLSRPSLLSAEQVARLAIRVRERLSGVSGPLAARLARSGRASRSTTQAAGRSGLPGWVQGPVYPVPGGVEGRRPRGGRRRWAAVAGGAALLLSSVLVWPHLADPVAQAVVDRVTEQPADPADGHSP